MTGCATTFYPPGLRSTIQVGALSPYVVRYDVSSADAALDLSRVVSAYFAITRSDGSGARWDCILQNQSATALRLIHPFDPGDVPEEDVIMLRPHMVLASGSGELVASAAELHVCR